jgi:hypothetical protein
MRCKPLGERGGLSHDGVKHERVFGGQVRKRFFLKKEAKTFARLSPTTQRQRATVFRVFS